MTHKELIKIREEKKLKKGQFAALIGISAMMQGRYESGKVAIPDDIAKKVLALGAAKDAPDAEKKTAKDAEKKTVKDAEKKTVKDAEKKAVKGSEKKTAKDAEKKAAKDAVKTAATVAAAEEGKKAADRKKKDTVLYIESQLGGRITMKEILQRIPAGADEVYVKPEENKAYWVKGEKTGDVDLW